MCVRARLLCACNACVCEREEAGLRVREGGSKQGPAAKTRASRVPQGFHICHQSSSCAMPLLKEVHPSSQQLADMEMTR